MAKKTTPKASRPPVRNVFQDGPHLTCFAVCEKVLEEKDGTKSAIRMVNRLTRRVAGENVPKEMAAFEHRFDVLVSLKRGIRGKEKCSYEIRIQNASGEQVRAASGTIRFDGGPGKGVDLRANLLMIFDREGTYWLELYIDEVLMSRQPIAVHYLIQEAPGPIPPPASIQ